MSLIDLRKELRAMTVEYAVWDHRQRLEDISKVYRNSISILECDVPMDCRCLSHALGLAKNSEYRRIQRSSMDFICQNIYAGAEFLNWLLSTGALEEQEKKHAQKGALVLYFCDNDWIHAGTLIDPETVVSKWGEGFLYEHSELEIPINYGSHLKYFRRVEPRKMLSTFKEFVSLKTRNDKSDICLNWLAQCGITPISI